MAKTFTDGQGNVRAIGGRIITPAPKPPAPKPAAVPKPTGGPVPAAARPTSGVGTVPAGTPAPRPAPAPAGAGKATTGTFGTPTSGYLKTRQKQADGTWKIVLTHRSQLNPEELKRVLANGLNGTTSTTGSTHADPGGGGGAGPGAAVPGTAAPAPALPAWTPPRIGLGGINANPITGQIDWASVIAAANGVSAMDPQYAREVSDVLASLQGEASVPQSEIQSLTTINPATGKTLYQTMVDQAMRQYGQSTSSAFGSAAARGIGSSGMVNNTVGQLTAANAEQLAANEQQYGNARVAALVNQITGILQRGGTMFDGAYYGSLGRANAGIPAIGA